MSLEKLASRGAATSGLSGPSSGHQQELGFSRLQIIRRIAASILVAGSLSSCGQEGGELTLTNAAQDVVAHASVSICERKFEFGPLDPGESGAASYRIDRDDSFKVEVTFVSGRMISKEDGYVTTGMSFRHRITVTDADIIISEARERTERSAGDAAR